MPPYPALFSTFKEISKLISLMTVLICTPPSTVSKDFFLSTTSPVFVVKIINDSHSDLGGVISQNSFNSRFLMASILVTFLLL